jgi:hypothetical protein
MKALIALVILLQSNITWAAEIRDLSVAFTKFLSDSNDLFMYPRQPIEGLALDMNIDICPHFYWNNHIHTTIDADQFRVVGWQTEIGVRLPYSVDLGFQHHSQHLLDDYSKTLPYPNSDGIVLRWHIYEKGTP